MRSPLKRLAKSFHGHVVGHLRAEHAPYGTDKFVSHGAHRQQVVLHGQVYVAGADKPAGPLLAVIARFQGTHHGIFALERGPAAGTEVAEYTPGLQEPFALFAGLRVVRVVVEVLALAGHGVVEFRDDSQQFYLQQNGVGPTAFDVDMQVPLLVLTHLHPLVVVAEALQVGVEPGGDIAALPFHKLDFFVGDDDRVEHLYLFAQSLGKSGRIDGVVAVGKGIFHLCSREVVDYGTAHGKLIQVIVGKVGDDLSHDEKILALYSTNVCYKYSER